MTFAVVVPTFNAGAGWRRWVDALMAQTHQPDAVMVIDSGSVDGTVDLSYDSGLDVLVIPCEDFDHGGTRRKAVLHCQRHDFVVLLTQDAILADRHALGNIQRSFQDEQVMAVCGRQLPREGSGPIEAHARLYNYPAKSFLRTYQDREQYGIKAAFLSNSFAAYRTGALAEIGSFPDSVIFGEDMYVAARLLLSGGKIAYAADACVYHSHNYGMLQEFSRYFDMGVFHTREPWLRKEFGGAEKEGAKFVISEFKYLARHAFWRIPEGLLRTVLRYLGFRLGLIEGYIPLSIKNRLCMNKGYFNKS